MAAATKVALWALFVAWVTCFGLSVWSAGHGVGLPSVVVTAAESPHDFPAVSGFVPPSMGPVVGLEIGDRLLRLADMDLQGVGRLGFFVRVLECDRTWRGIPVVYERDGQRGMVELALRPLAVTWFFLPVSAASAAVALLLWLRARPSRETVAGALALWCTAIFFASIFGGGETRAYGSLLAGMLSVALAGPLILRAAFLFPDGCMPTSHWARAGPWAFVVLGPLVTSALYGLPLARSVGFPLYAAVLVIYLSIVLLIATHRYRETRPVARRRLKWLLFGVYCGSLPAMILAIATAIDYRFVTAYLVSMCAFVAFPICLFIAIRRYNLFDIDRVISGTASSNILVAAGALGAFVGVPRGARVVASQVGIDPLVGQVLLALLLAAAAVPAYRRLRLKIEAVFFRERYRTDRGMQALLAELSRCADTRTLIECAGARLDELLMPENCVLYTRAEHGYVPSFVAGRVVPPATFATSGPLIATLRSNGAPVVLGGAGRSRRASPVSPFERAALETLEAAVVVPVKRGKALRTLICLGRKRSGDVYTPTDIALLAAVADKMAAQLLRFKDVEIMRRAREMQASLRRYVPEVLVEQIGSRGEPEAGEREVAILFVDLRDYTGYAEGRPVAEVFATVSQYTQTVSTIVRAHGGHFVEFSGDGMMAIFGAPVALAAKERAAVEAGREIFAAVAALTPPGTATEPGRFSVGVGIATGPAFVGSIRAADRLIWAAIGSSTNLAARLQALTREIDAAVVIDERTWRGLGAAEPGFEHRPGVSIRGRRGREDVYLIPLARAARDVTRGAPAGRAPSGDGLGSGASGVDPAVQAAPPVPARRGDS